MKAETWAWMVLVGAGVLEMVWAVGLKYSQGFSRLIPSIVTLLAMAVSFIFLSQSLKVLPVGTAYAVWTGIGAAGTALLGIWIFGESASLWRLFYIGLIVIGIIGLKFST